MANKYILVPEEIYNGLTANPPPPPPTQNEDLNLAFTKATLEKVKHLPIDSEKKNVLYNQELQRFRHLHKEHMDKPSRVVISDADASVAESDTAATIAAAIEASSGKVPSKRHRERKDKDRSRRSKAPSPEERPLKARKHSLSLSFGFKPRVWN
jgi:hypothetical protein